MKKHVTMDVLVLILAVFGVLYLSTQDISVDSKLQCLGDIKNACLDYFSDCGYGRE